MVNNYIPKFQISGVHFTRILNTYCQLFLLLLVTGRLCEFHFPLLTFSACINAGFYLLGRVIAATSCVTLAASLAARLGSTPMAAFQICLQVWMTSSLLADGLAVAGQVTTSC